jgi:hypothetical protein
MTALSYIGKTAGDVSSSQMPPCHSTKGMHMFTTLHLTPIVSLIAGVLILAIPRLLNYIIALYLIVIGLIGLFGTR